jgi:3-oxoacyl-[acyl-carrier protein] reductase
VKNLSGKTALATGVSRGIGRATALALAEAGAQTLVHYSRAEHFNHYVLQHLARTFH